MILCGSCVHEYKPMLLARSELLHIVLFVLLQNMNTADRGSAATRSHDFAGAVASRVELDLDESW